MNPDGTEASSPLLKHSLLGPRFGRGGKKKKRKRLPFNASNYFTSFMFCFPLFLSPPNTCRKDLATRERSTHEHKHTRRRTGTRVCDPPLNPRYKGTEEKQRRSSRGRRCRAGLDRLADVQCKVQKRQVNIIYSLSHPSLKTKPSSVFSSQPRPGEGKRAP